MAHRAVDRQRVRRGGLQRRPSVPACCPQGRRSEPKEAHSCFHQTAPSKQSKQMGLKEEVFLVPQLSLLVQSQSLIDACPSFLPYFLIEIQLERQTPNSHTTESRTSQGENNKKGNNFGTSGDFWMTTTSVRKLKKWIQNAILVFDFANVGNKQ